MLSINKNVSLKTLNTFKIDVISKGFVSIKNFNELKKALENNNYKDYRILGGGSNILFTNNFDGLTIHIANKGISITNESIKDVIVEISAGENWHDIVLWAIKNNFGGIENLSLIPGSVGAAPIQNIGAYGVELKDVFYCCEALNIKTKQIKKFYVEDCEFEYRSSIFKTKEKNNYVIMKVFLKLSKEPHNYNISYGKVKEHLKNKKKSIQNISEAIIKIRKSKLPDISKFGNAGSFFKNPTIDLNHYENLKNKFNDILGYKSENNKIKISAGWLIEKLGYKGLNFGNVGVYKKQALVLINNGNAKGIDILKVAKKIQNDVKINFDIDLEYEVNIL
ncbi:MAG: UDP-N-acetylenolpyruvoylglucosamine reductase [Flavobacteriaceae bacterium]|nr:UDP-N-acetylenolpyruvoylglucosamine reductase [Flavobacteriaceae bacterium]